MTKQNDSAPDVADYLEHIATFNGEIGTIQLRPETTKRILAALRTAREPVEPGNHTVTQSARDAAAELYGALHNVWPGYSACVEISEGCTDNDYVAQAFARHAAQARREGVEEAAAIAEDKFGDVEIAAAIRAKIGEA